MIIGWVALWEPTTFILYDWREGAHGVNAYIRLSLAETEFAVNKKHRRDI